MKEETPGLRQEGVPPPSIVFHKTSIGILMKEITSYIYFQIRNDVWVFIGYSIRNYEELLMGSKGYLTNTNV
jgi:hypothetical protein